MSYITNLDMSVLNFIYDNIRCAFLDVLMPLITLFGESGIFFIAIAVLLLISRKTRKTGITLGLSLLIGLVVCNLTLKPLIARPRPYTVRTDVIMLVEALSDYSFPSGHTVAAFEAATVMMIRHRKVGIAFLVLAILIAFSRLYLFVHYPTDVLAGAVLGIASGVAAALAVNAVYKRFQSKNDTPSIS